MQLWYEAFGFHNSNKEAESFYMSINRTEKNKDTDSKQTVFVSGKFEILHPGHLRLFLTPMQVKLPLPKNYFYLEVRSRKQVQ